MEAVLSGESWLNEEGATKVLIADDNADVTESLTGMLIEAGYAIVGVAPDGLEAVALTQSLQPDVVLMDVRMQDMDGIEAARLIHEACPTPVVILTAYDTPELLREASSAGVGMYLVKPTTPEELDRAIAISMARFDDTMELRRLNEQLQARNRELDAFAYTVAHDLKNPLQFITNYAELLLDDWASLPEEEINRRLAQIEKNGLRMSNIIDELMLLAQTRQADVQVEPLDMGHIVSEALARVAYLAEQHEAEVDYPDDWPQAVGYAPWVEEVWVNYVSNAVKYGGEPPRIEIGADQQSDGTIRFWIRDGGQGIVPEDQERLFTPFTRLDQISTQGQGLGLSIVLSIVEKLGGEVGVKSVVGEGSTFSFTLPPA